MSIMAKTPSGYKKIGSAYLGERPVDKVFNANGDVVYALQRELTGVPPLLFKGKEQSELLNYRIYGDTVDGESVGDRTANLIQGSIKNANIGNDGKINTSNEFFLVYAPVVTGESYTISNNNGTNVYAFYNAVPSTETATSYDSNRQIFSTSTITFVSPITGYIAVRLANTAQDIMINPGSTALPYEPYGYKVPVTVEGKNLLNPNFTRFAYAINGASYFTPHVGEAVYLIPIKNNTAYTIKVYSSGTISVLRLGLYNKSSPIADDYVTNLQEALRTTSPSLTIINTTYKYLVIQISATYVNNYGLNNVMLNTGSTALPYEPYHAPVTTPIYLPEPIKMEAHQADFVDYATQTFQTRKVVYGWHIDPTISNSFNAVTYLEDAVGMTPAAMGSDTFSYGSWGNAFFMPKPCMLKSDGTVDYYLFPNDYTKKMDGTPSDVANPDYDGNAMMEWGKIWYKFVGTEIDGEGYFYVSNYKVDNTYHCWCNIDSQNNETDHFYTAIYNGTGTTKLRSISGVALTSANGNGNTNVTEEVTRATANNTTSAVEWYTEVFSDKLLINALLVLMGKSLNTQVVFGRGLDFGGRTAKEAYITGTLNDKGLFWGVTANGNSAVKVFGMENWWGCVWHRVAGCISVSNTLKVKLTYNTADGSTTNGYNQTGSSYIDNGDIPTSNGYLKTMRYNKLGYSPSSVIGSSSESYYGDYFYQNAGTDYLLLGGRSGDGVAAGPFCFDLNHAPGYRYWDVAASLSCKPLAGKNPEPGNIRSISLPALPVLPGTNTMSIDTTVQPSRMDIKGRIKSLT